MKKTLWLFLFTLLCVVYAQAQDRYMVFFNDKAGTPYSIENPEEFLSQRALDRRTRQNIPLVANDLPVNPQYVNEVANQGAATFFTTKWMNGVLVEMTAADVPTIEALSFVSHVEFVAPGAQLLTDNADGDEYASVASAEDMEATDFQNQMIGIDQMHELGFRGQNMLIAIFDNGFNGLSQISAFTHLREQNHILYTYDFTEDVSQVENVEDHGTRVLSVMAADSEELYTGSAPDATYILSVTEDDGEYRVEEYNWLFAAERADSAGVDLIQASLGYNIFTDPAMSYTYEQMDGQTTVVTRAANLAGSKGIFVVTSAGNEGNRSSWPYIKAPADSEQVLAIGAVNSTLNKAGFSSIGPSADGRTKPDVAALGVATSTISETGSVFPSSGTSFAAPLVAGLAAGLWTAYPELTNNELRDLIRQSAHQANTPDDLLGFGIPNFNTALQIAEEIDLPLVNELTIYPNPVELNFFTIAFDDPYLGLTVNMSLYTLNGDKLNDFEVIPTASDNRMRIAFEEGPGGPGANGMYLLRINSALGAITRKILKY